MDNADENRFYCIFYFASVSTLCFGVQNEPLCPRDKFVFRIICLLLLFIFYFLHIHFDTSVGFRMVINDVDDHEEVTANADVARKNRMQGFRFDFYSFCVSLCLAAVYSIWKSFRKGRQRLNLTFVHISNIFLSLNEGQLK